MKDSVYLVGLLSALLGSILTVLIGKFFDIFQKSKEHQYALRKIFFERKLAVAEDLFIQWQVLVSEYGKLAVVFDRLSEKEENTNIGLLNNSLADALNNITKISEHLSSAIYLYFNLDSSEIINREYFNKIIDTLSPIRDLTDEIDINTKLANDPKYILIKDKFQGEINSLIEDMKPHLKILSNIIEESKNTTSHLMKSIRCEFEKYDN